MNFRLRAKALLGGVAFAMAALGLSGGEALARTNYAIVVGVTAYPNLPKNAWLVGPRNDALLVRDYLLTQSPVPFEAGNVAILADDVDGGREPTLGSILATLDEVAGKAEAGDFLYLQFSGHGFQQTAADPSTETDGLDEIFLPKDTGRWVDRSKGMPNALVDDQVGAALDRIRDKGAFVWVVFDACHSGTATRAAPGDDVQERKIDPEMVGMPEEILQEAVGTRDIMAREAPVETAPGEPTGAASARKGGMVSFFAAQTNETTPEMPLPKGAENATKYGLFTHTIFTRLAENPAVTYRQLAEGILQQYAAINRTSTTPLFEGDLDAPVFGTEIDNYVPQWRIKVADSGVTVPGGLVNGLVPGTRLAILEKAGDPSDAAIGYLEVKSAENFTSRLTMAPVPEPAAGGDAAAKEGEAAATTLRVRTLADIPDGAVARMIEAKFDFTLTVARPEPSDDHPERVEMVNALLDSIAADDTRPMRIELVEPGKAADLRLAVAAEADLPDADFSAPSDPVLWFLPESGELSLEEGRRSPSIVMQSEDRKAIGEAIDQYLTRIYRATNLARIGQGTDYGPQEVDVSFTLRRQGTGEETPISTTSLPVGQPGDRVSVSAKNNTGSAVDVNVLYVGSDYSITFIGKERLQPSATYEAEFLEFTADSFGRELMVAVMSEAQPLSPTLDLSYLEQGGLRTVTRGPEPQSVADLIEAMGSGVATRAAKPLTGGADRKQRGAVMLFPVQTLPRS